MTATVEDFTQILFNEDSTSDFINDSKYRTSIVRLLLRRRNPERGFTQASHSPSGRRYEACSRLSRPLPSSSFPASTASLCNGGGSVSCRQHPSGSLRTRRGPHLRAQPLVKAPSPWAVQAEGLSESLFSYITLVEPSLEILTANAGSPPQFRTRSLVIVAVSVNRG